jgi:hypothetical protein
MTDPYPLLVDPTTGAQQQVRWTYWPVNFAFGNLTVISNTPMPLSGVKMSAVMRGVGMMRASLQLADEEVRALDPWSKIVPRKTGLVAVRTVVDVSTGAATSTVPWYGTVWAAPRDPQTGRMDITAMTIEGNWARRLITKGKRWDDVDQQQIAADLLDPAVWSLLPLGPAMWPGWITVDPPTVPTGVARDFEYDEHQETNLLEAMQRRSQLSTNSYEWRTDVRVLSGLDPLSADTFRPVFVLGFPELGRQLGDVFPVPRFRFDTAGSGNVVEFKVAFDGSDVPNVVWGTGKGYEDLQTRVQVQNTDGGGFSEWEYGFLQTEARFSDPDVSVESTLIDYCYRYMYDRLGSEQFIASLTVRGDLLPYFDSYTIGDALILETNDRTWPPSWYNGDGWVELSTRIFGWTITPPQGATAETVELLISGGQL